MSIKWELERENCMYFGMDLSFCGHTSVTGAVFNLWWRSQVVKQKFCYHNDMNMALVHAEPTNRKYFIQRNDSIEWLNENEKKLVTSKNKNQIAKPQLNVSLFDHLVDLHCTLHIEHCVFMHSVHSILWHFQQIFCHSILILSSFFVCMAQVSAFILSKFQLKPIVKSSIIPFDYIRWNIVFKWLYVIDDTVPGRILIFECEHLFVAQLLYGSVFARVSDCVPIHFESPVFKYS